MRSVSVTTDLACQPDAVMEALCSIQAFVHVARPALRMPVAEAIVDPIAVGQQISGRLRFGGLLPLTRHTIRVVSIDRAVREIVTSESGGFVRRWDHTIRVTPGPEGTARYEDAIDIDAGILTLLVVGFAHLFYRHRQRRWRHLAPVLDGAARVRASR
ncbi:MAG: hypothetical protein AAGG08_00665 [Actinomycetota bacterium]